MKAKIDADLCCGCGPCEEECPEVFKVDGDTAIVLVDEVPASAMEACQKAKENCPTEAIILED